MQLVIADTTPVNYLILIGHIEVVPALFQRLILPSVVRDELSAGPPTVQRWISEPPSWLEIRTPSLYHPLHLPADLDPGEAEVIALALEMRADVLLMDDREGVMAARNKQLVVIGTLGVLGLAAQQGLLDLAEAFDQIKHTNFRYRQKMLDALLAEASGKS